jgi:hypothetical protein
MRIRGLVVLLLGASLTCACSTPSAPPTSSDGGAWSTGSITSAPATRPCCAPAAAPVVAGCQPPADAPAAQMRPGEVWCKVHEPARYETRCEQVQVCGPHWEWRRTHECDVPGSQGTKSDGVALGQTWCYVKVAGRTQTRTQRVLVAPERWTWKRAPECEVPRCPPGTPAP